MTRQMTHGPSEIARAAKRIIEGMKGEPLDEEIADVMTDAIWEAFSAGRDAEAAAKPKRKRKALASPAAETPTNTEEKTDGR